MGNDYNGLTREQREDVAIEAMRGQEAPYQQPKLDPTHLVLNLQDPSLKDPEAPVPLDDLQFLHRGAKAGRQGHIASRTHDKR